MTPDGFTDIPGPDAGTPEYRDYERLGSHLYEHVLEEVSGTGPDDRGERALADLPSDIYFAGNVVPSGEAEMSGLSDDLQAKLSPSAIQAAFLLDRREIRDATLEVTVSGHVYYRTFPTAEEQFEQTHVSVSDLGRDDGRSTDAGTQEFVTVYRRLEFESDPIEIEIPSWAQIESRDIVAGGVEKEVTDELVESLKQRLDNRESRSVVPSEADLPDRAPPVWRAAADVVAPGSIDVSDLPGAPDEATLGVDDYTGEYQIPSGLFDHDDDDRRREALDSVVERIVGRADDYVSPEWDIDITCEFVEDDGQIRGELLVENTSEPSADASDYDTEYGANVYDTTIFDLTATIEVTNGEFEDFTFERLEEDFRYDRNLPGHGTSCTVSKVDEQTLETQYLPTYRQRRYETRDPESFDPPLDTSFETLSDLRGGGIKALENVAERMHEYEDEVYDESLETYRETGEFRAQDKEDFERDREAFRTEIERFERGIECLKRDLKREDGGDVARSFELMNRTFVEKVTDDDGQMEYDSWRLFQLVFIVRILPDIVSRENDSWADVDWRDGDAAEDFAGDDLEALDIVDIVWFPTGGGKTEAYLGLSIFGAFFDRKRGKRYGVTAWTRFPLRLLSLQQTQRIGELLMHAELLRLREDDISGDEYFPFTLGYLVGSGNTPNKLSNYTQSYDDDDAYLREYNKFVEGEGNDEQREEVNIFPSCPVCGAEVKIRATEDLRLAHYCTAPESECAYQQRERPASEDYEIFAKDELPVHIVDNELYRYAPTMIVGTIDKITAVGYERKSAHVYAGKMTHWCPDHGFASFGECTEKYGCHGRYGGSNSDDGDHLVPLSETPFGRPYDAAPDLQIQDELHLLEETLGTFDSHFETFTDRYQRYNGEQRTKIVGATATIEEYDEQVQDLYIRRAERFPEQGPELGESFYATTNEPTRRRFAGIMPHGKTHINAVIQINYYYIRAIERLRERLQNDDTVQLIHRLDFETVDTNDELLELLDAFETCLTYTISKRDKDRYDQSMRGQIADYLRKDGLPEPRLEELTGDTRFDDVEDILDNLEEPPTNHEDRYNVIAATNMISHGVDVDRFNFMVFFGMPRQTAEYIQSSSRAGRTYPGNVLICFNPARERDQSHYHLFEKYHAFLDRLVEPVPINRWSHYSVKRTLPSMVFAWLLNQWLYESGERLFFGDNVSDLIRSLEAGNGGRAGVSIDDVDEFVELLRESYGADLNGDLPEAFDNLLRKEADRIFSQLEDIRADFASEALDPGPMTSLRDIDDPIPFKPHDDDNRRLFNQLSRR